MNSACERVFLFHDTSPHFTLSSSFRIELNAYDVTTMIRYPRLVFWLAPLETPIIDPWISLDFP